MKNQNEDVGPKSQECKWAVQVQQKLYNQEVRVSKCSLNVSSGR